MDMKNLKNTLLTILLAASMLSCQGSTTQPAEKKVAALPDTGSALKVKNAGNDEKAFRLALTRLKALLKAKNLNAATTMLNFPFFTAKASDDRGEGAAIDPIAIKEYPAYKNDIFNADVVRLLPTYTEEQLSEIDAKTDDPYYRSLAKLTDSGSKLYEVYFQYPEKGTNAECFFGFVFGKVHGQYKAVGMYGKWPIK